VPGRCEHQTSPHISLSLGPHPGSRTETKRQRQGRGGSGNGNGNGNDRSADGCDVLIASTSITQTSSRLIQHPSPQPRVRISPLLFSGWRRVGAQGCVKTRRRASPAPVFPCEEVRACARPLVVFAVGFAARPSPKHPPPSFRPCARAHVCVYLCVVPSFFPPSSPIRSCTYPWLLAVVLGWRRRREGRGEGRGERAGHDGGGTTSRGLRGYRIRFPWTCEEETGIQSNPEIRGSELLGFQNPNSESSRARCLWGARGWGIPEKKAKCPLNPFPPLCQGF